MQKHLFTVCYDLSLAESFASHLTEVTATTPLIETLSPTAVNTPVPIINTGVTPQMLSP